MKNAFYLFLIAFIFICDHYVVGQNKVDYDIYKLYQDKKITIYNRNANLFQDKAHKGIKLDENSNEGIVWFNDVTFSNGAIEIDVKGKDLFQKSFVGIAFHGVNDSTYDAIYFRPFNFHAKDSIRKIHAVQYISHPTYTWKKLRDEHNGIYEKRVVDVPDPNDWFHARIEVLADSVYVYVNNSKVPSLTVKKLNTNKNGKIGLWVGDGSGGEFANFKITN